MGYSVRQELDATVEVTAFSNSCSLNSLNSKTQPKPDARERRSMLRYAMLIHLTIMLAAVSGMRCCRWGAPARHAESGLHPSAPIPRVMSGVELS